MSCARPARPAWDAVAGGTAPAAGREPGEPAPEDAAAYAARLTAEVSRHGRWHGLR